MYIYMYIQSQIACDVVRFVLALDRLRYTSNLGILLRSAAMFKINFIFYINGNADPFNWKVLVRQSFNSFCFVLFVFISCFVLFCCCLFGSTCKTVALFFLFCFVLFAFVFILSVFLLLFVLKLLARQPLYTFCLFVFIPFVCFVCFVLFCLLLACLLLLFVCFVCLFCLFSLAVVFCFILLNNKYNSFYIYFVCVCTPHYTARRHLRIKKLK